jgi:hypothetical protein
MLNLMAKYKQTENGRWDAYVIGYKHITVEQAEDLETAKVILRIITAEEMGASSSRRVDWDIGKEVILHYVDDTPTTSMMLPSAWKGLR